MTNDTYPLPRADLRIAASNINPEYTTVEEREDAIFGRADHFTVVRFGTHNGSESTTRPSFAEAVYLAHDNPRALVYAVCSITGESFCVARKRWEHFAEVCLNRRSAPHA